MNLFILFLIEIDFLFYAVHACYFDVIFDINQCEFAPYYYVCNKNEEFIKWIIA